MASAAAAPLAARGAAGGVPTSARPRPRGAAGLVGPPAGAAARGGGPRRRQGSGVGAAVAAAAAGLAGAARGRGAARPAAARGAEGGEAARAGPEGALPPDRLVRYLGGNVSCRALEATSLVREACQRHGCSPTASVALGRALLGAALLANGRDAGETLQIRISGSGPCGAIITEATSSGEGEVALGCRGFVAEPQADAATVPELVGVDETATMRVTRTHPFWRSPYTGTTPLKTGEIAEDIVQYLAVSEQTPASMGLSVDWDNEANRVRHAEGWLVTLLPGWEDGEVGAVEANIANFGRERDDGRPRPEAICEHLMRELVGTFQMEEKVEFQCRCTTSRLLTAIMMFGKQEVADMVAQGEDVEATCDWCGGSLSVTAEQIQEHLASDQGMEQVRTGGYSPRQLRLKENEMAAMPLPGEAKWT